MNLYNKYELHSFINFKDRNGVSQFKSTRDSDHAPFGEVCHMQARTCHGKLCNVPNLKSLASLIPKIEKTTQNLQNKVTWRY